MTTTKSSKSAGDTRRARPKRIEPGIEANKGKELPLPRLNPGETQVLVRYTDKIEMKGEQTLNVWRTVIYVCGPVAHKGGFTPAMDFSGYWVVLPAGPHTPYDQIAVALEGLRHPPPGVVIGG